MADVEIAPSELKFRFQLNKQLPTAFTIRNPSGDRVAFKVKTTTPKKYVVRPTAGVVEPGSTATVQVIMQAQKEVPADIGNCKDKFLVQVKALAPGEEVNQDTFKTGTGVRDSRIRVVLEGPSPAPETVPEGNESASLDGGDSLRTAPASAQQTEGFSSAFTSASGGTADVSQEIRALRAQLQQITAERDSLRTKLEKASKGGAAGSSVQGNAGPMSPMSLLPLLLVGLLAFVVGHYLQRVSGVSR